MKIMNKKEFATKVLNANDEIFMVHIAALVKLTNIPIYSFCQAQVALLTSEETGISAEYFDFFNVFSSDSATKLQEYTESNDHSINLLDNKHLLYDPIYSLGPVELEILKIYIKANLASNFISPSNCLASALILFI